MPTEGINPHELMKILLYGSQEHTDPQGVLPFISHIGMCRPKGWGFVPFWSENGYRFCPYWSGIGCVSIPNEQERKRYMQVRMEVKKSFLLLF